MITLESRVFALSMSSRIAELPPTSAPAPSTACTAVRTSSTVSKAAVVVESTREVGGDERDAVLDDRLARAPRGSRCRSWPSATSSALSALATTITGVELSARPCVVSTF